ncbi:HEAT repeat domain-containing protein [Acidobacteriia bacterium AH_259_A11_L15]|nr:HEAT repeat domain-containing protein [Acidobacteriia bacterium AH_259_A11_L15]
MKWVGLILLVLAALPAGIFFLRRALPLVMEWTRYGRPPRAREAAIESLGKLGKARPAGQADADRVLNRLLELLDDPYIWARRSALRGLGELGDRRAMPALEEFAASELERRLQREAEIALDKLRRAPVPGRR